MASQNRHGGAVKNLTFIFTLMLSFTLSVCAQGGDEQTEPQKKGNCLTVFYSWSGNSRAIANNLRSVVGGDIVEVTPTTPYPVDYNQILGVAQQEIAAIDSGTYPAINNPVSNIADYDTVFIVYPLWWSRMATPMQAFLHNQSANLRGKTIALVCTSTSTGISQTVADAKRLCPESIFTEALHIRSAQVSSANNLLDGWLKKTGVSIGGDSRPQFNFETKTVLLNSGYEMPIAGLGTYSLQGDVCVNSITAFLNAGGRLIDTAYMYGNEESVGRAVRASSVPREEIFVITKLYPNQFANAEASIDEALRKLGLDYIDMMLLHHPGSNDVSAYKAMERAVKAGKIRSIGLSNWYVKELESFLPQITIRPALVQNEIHPYYQENDVIPYIQQKGIVVQGWFPLGGRGYTAALLGNEVISSIAQAHGKSSAQVILRWNLQKGVVVIPGSSNPDHIRENLDLFDFELTDEEMAKINGLDRNEKHDWY